MWRFALLTCVVALHAHCALSSSDTVSKRVEQLRFEAQGLLLGEDKKTLGDNLPGVIKTIRNSKGVPSRRKQELIRHSKQLLPALALVQEQTELASTESVCREVSPPEVEVSEDEWFVIAVHFNIIRPEGTAEECLGVGCSIKDQDVRHIMDEMNQAYLPAQIAFYLHGISRHTVEASLYEALSGGTGEVLLKHRYNKDPARVLNVYVTDFRSMLNTEETKVVGMATFPYGIESEMVRDVMTEDLALSVARGTLDEELLSDLVSRHYVSSSTTSGSMGGSSGEHQVTFGWAPRSFMQGILLLTDSAWKDGAPILIHETGHYLGLHHTFYGGCDSVDGDCVDDTPPTTAKAQVFSWQMCRNPKPYSCPHLRSKAGAGGQELSASWRDPVRNYMGYSDTACANEFTAGQIARMRLMYKRYRLVDWAALAHIRSGGEDEFTIAFSEAAKALCGEDAGCPITLSAVERMHSMVTHRWRQSVLQDLEGLMEDYWHEVQRVKEAHAARTSLISSRPRPPARRRRRGAASRTSKSSTPSGVDRSGVSKKAQASVLDDEFRVSVMSLPYVMAEYEVMWPDDTVEQFAQRMSEKSKSSLDIDTKEWIKNVALWEDTRRLLRNIARGKLVNMEGLGRMLSADGAMFPHDRDALNTYDLHVRTTKDKRTGMGDSFEYLYPEKHFLAELATLVSSNSFSEATSAASAGAEDVFMMIQQLTESEVLDVVEDDTRLRHDIADACVGHWTECRLLLLIVNQWLVWNEKMAAIKPAADDSAAPNGSSAESFVLLVSPYMEDKALVNELKSIAAEVAEIKAEEEAASLADRLTNIQNRCIDSWKKAMRWNSRSLFEVAERALLDAHWNRVEVCANAESSKAECDDEDIKGLLVFSRQLLESANPLLGQHIYNKEQYLRSADFLERSFALFRSFATLHVRGAGLGYGAAMDDVLSWEVGMVDANEIGPAVVYAKQSGEEGELESQPCVQGDGGCVVLLSLVGNSKLTCTDMGDMQEELKTLEAEGGVRSKFIWNTAVQFFECLREGKCQGIEGAVQVLHPHYAGYIDSLYAKFSSCGVGGDLVG